MPGGEQLDEREDQLIGALLDHEHTDVCAVDLDDLPRLAVKGAGEQSSLDGLVPAPRPLHVLPEGGPVQLEGPFEVGWRDQPQLPDGDVRVGHGQRMPQPEREARYDPPPP
jgi:hypothetical protein